MSESEYILELLDVCNEYRSGIVNLRSSKKSRQVLNHVNLKIRKNEFFGLVGESGCGKSTLGKSVLGLLDYQGEIFVDGKKAGKNRQKEFSKYIQAVFQDPLSALNPRKKIGFLMEEPLKIHRLGSKSWRLKKVNEVLELIGLDASYYDRYPRELSGGQRQRICIGCALMLNPQLIVADEPISALDVSVGAQILNLFREIHDKMDLSLLFISHNLDLVYYLCDRIAVMYKGTIVELGSADDIFTSPKHPYTKLLLAANPNIEWKSTIDRLPEIVETEEAEEKEWNHKECPFLAKCSEAMETCRNQIPGEYHVSQKEGEVHFVRCFLYQ